jgi:outer membrane protein OmpA-like peptidoglycan-associated protein
MRNKIIALVSASLIANASMAADDVKGSSREGPGVAIGTIAGAVLGGPVGFIVGGGLGGWLGNKIHKEKRKAETYEARYRESDALAESLQALLADSETEIDRMQLVMDEREVAYRDTMTEALGIQIYFRTGESTLDEQVAERIERLGRIMRDFENFAIVVEGHADPRGEDDYNVQLSADRATSVRAALIDAGLDPSQIMTRATGESASRAAEGDIDAMALERRVDLRIVQPLPRENRVASQ